MLKKRWLNAVCVLSACHPCLSGDVWRCWRWLGQRLFHIALHGGVLIESGHGLSSGGYTHDAVLLDSTMAEHDSQSSYIPCVWLYVQQLLFFGFLSEIPPSPCGLCTE